MQEQVEGLEKSYDNLGEAIEKAYSTDASELIDQQNELLEQQKILIQGQIAEEKNKKKSDNGRIEEWQNQLESIDKQIGENKEKQLDAIMVAILNLPSMNLHRRMLMRGRREMTGRSLLKIW